MAAFATLAAELAAFARAPIAMRVKLVVVAPRRAHFDLGVVLVRGAARTKITAPAFAHRAVVLPTGRVAKILAHFVIGVTLNT